MSKKDKKLSGKIRKKADAVDLLLAETDSLIYAAEGTIAELEDRTQRRNAREDARRAEFERRRATGTRR